MFSCDVIFEIKFLYFLPIKNCYVRLSFCYSPTVNLLMYSPKLVCVADHFFCGRLACNNTASAVVNLVTDTPSRHVVVRVPRLIVPIRRARTRKTCVVPIGAKKRGEASTQTVFLFNLLNPCVKYCATFRNLDKRHFMLFVRQKFSL